MPILAATSRPCCECSFRYILLKAVAKGKPAGPRPFLENCSLLGNGATSGLRQNRQASSYISYIFLLILEFLKQSTINANCCCLVYMIMFNLNFENISSLFFKISLLEQECFPLQS